MEKERVELNNLIEKHKAKEDAFVPELARLLRARKAMLMDEIYAVVSSCRNQLSDERSKLKVEEEALPELEASANAQAKALADAEEGIRKTKEDLKAVAPLIQKIRSLDQTIADQATAIAICLCAISINHLSSMSLITTRLVK